MIKQSDDGKMTSDWTDIIRSVTTPLGFFVLVVLVVEVIFGITASFNQGADRTYLIIGMLAIIFLLIIIVAGTAIFRPEALSGKRGPEKSEEHPSDKSREPLSQVTLDTNSLTQDWVPPKVRVPELRECLINDDFIPNLIIGISRSGLEVAAFLSEKFDKKPPIPVISLWPHRKFDNPLNNIVFTREYFGAESNPIKILIVDDACNSGKTLDGAREYVENHLDKANFKIATAAITFSELYSDPIPPTYFVHREKGPIITSLGNTEPVP